ncbi:MAG: DUF1007 family protein [Alphaproteobacteria bacterium]|nr:MAG: DUF1007 family protein [Alphaproteobacteria bacterium]
MTRLIRCFALAALALLAAGKAQAHPHVWVTMKSELIFSDDGRATGIRHAWTFDDMFSTFATQGLESKEKGRFTREELAPLAQVNVESLRDFDYFSVARANGKKADLGAPVDYWLEFKDGLLTLHFTLPFKTPAKAQTLDVEVYDASYFVDFALAEKEPVTLVGAPQACKLAVARPGESGAATAKPGEAFFNNLAPGSNFGAQFSNKISVTCP